MVPLGALHKKFLVTRKIKMKQSSENLCLRGFKRDSSGYFEML